jgi:hypothetical protein
VTQGVDSELLSVLDWQVGDKAGNVERLSALHDVVEYWDGRPLKVFRGTVTMIPDDKSKPVVRPVMNYFCYMDEKEPSKVRKWFGSVGPIQF